MPEIKAIENFLRWSQGKCWSWIISGSQITCQRKMLAREKRGSIINQPAKLRTVENQAGGYASLMIVC